MENRKLREILEYTSNNIPYYINYFNSNKKLDPLDLNSYPPIRKEDIMRNPNLFLSMDNSMEQLLTFNTSGSTGIPLTIYKSPKDKMAQLKSIWKIRMLNYDITPPTKGLAFHFFRFDSSSNSTEKDIIINGTTLSINAVNLDDEYIKRHIQTIDNFGPEFIMGSPSVVYALLKSYENLGIQLPKTIRYIELMGEYVFNYQREYITNRTNAIVCNHYGCTEIYGIAQEYSGCNNMHVLSDNAYLEVCANGKIVNEDNREGEILVTGLNSFAMPFVRYRIGDIGKIKKSCSCNSKGPIIQLNAGRANDYITLPDGRKRHSAVFCNIIEKINSTDRKIEKFKIIQAEIYSFEVYICTVNSNYQKEIKELFIKGVQDLGMNQSNYTFYFVPFNELPNIKNKFSCFENIVHNLIKNR